jgi:hypothetical protein
MSDYLGGRTRPGAADQTVPYGTDRVCIFPRRVMPGYLHFVSPGQFTFRAINAERADSELKLRTGPMKRPVE